MKNIGGANIILSKYFDMYWRNHLWMTSMLMGFICDGRGQIEEYLKGNMRKIHIPLTSQPLKSFTVSMILNENIMQGIMLTGERNSFVRWKSSWLRWKQKRDRAQWSCINSLDMHLRHGIWSQSSLSRFKRYICLLWKKIFINKGLSRQKAKVHGEKFWVPCLHLT